MITFSRLGVNRVWLSILRVVSLDHTPIKRVPQPNTDEDHLRSNYRLLEASVYLNYCKKGSLVASRIFESLARWWMS